MAKLTLSDITNLENQSTAVAALNANSALVETALENTLSRDGTSPNTMFADLDMNSKRILNLAAAVLDTEPVRLAEVGNAPQYAEDAADSAASALASQVITTADAATSTTNAATATTKAAEAAASAVLAQAAAGVNISSMTNRGVMIATGTNSGTSTTALTDGQLLVGQTGANPLQKTITGDVTFTAAGATAIKTSVSLTTPVLGVATATSINKMAITTPATSSTLTVADGKTLTASNSLTLAGTDSTTMTFPAISTNVGFRELPQISQSAAYTTILTDNGKHIYHPSADTTARVWTIDSNANVAYPIGSTLTFINDTSGGVITISITSDTLVLAGAGTTGSRTLAANGIAVATKMTSTRWIISGTGLT